MEQSKTVQVWVGVFVLIGMVSLWVLAMKVSNISTFTNAQGYVLTLDFSNIGGLKVRSPVTMAGVVIGRVSQINLDKQTYEAQVQIKIEDQYNNIPEDTSASIYTAGLLGEQYISLEPGGSDAFLKDGGKIKLTQSAVVLEQLIGQFLVDKSGGKSGG
jgi:phospholipid/cholesterol/gamma-HCH transport system substrate-binding protein